MTTKIEWADETWNPVTGCAKISAGCLNCYAERKARRLAGWCGYPEAPNHFDVTLHLERMNDLIHMRIPRRIFVCSMGDLFHDDVPEDYIAEIWMTMIASRQHVFQVLTKRPERMAKVLPKLFRDYFTGDTHISENIWLGVTCENQETADERIPWLLKTPAAVRFVSVEPMLTRVNMKINTSAPDASPPMDGCWYNVLAGTKGRLWGAGGFAKLDWVICGGETGPGAREMKEEWVINLWQQCQNAGVPFFFKKPGDAYRGSTDHPAFETREWPEVAA